MRVFVKITHHKENGAMQGSHVVLHLSVNAGFWGRKTIQN